MKPVDQDEFYPRGNCWEACIASILELPLEALRQHGNDRHDFHAKWVRESTEREAYAHHEAYQRAQRRLGFVVVKVYPSRENDGYREDGSYRCPGAIPRGYAMANGVSPRTKPDGTPILHSVVVLDGVIVHDPHPSRAGLVSIDEYEVLVPVVAP